MSESRDTANLVVQGDVSAPSIVDACTKPYDGQIQENISEYSSHFASSGSGEKEDDYDYEAREENTRDIVKHYYTLVSDFFEYGYGQSFHFAPAPAGKTFANCIRDYEHELARLLNARPGMKILDIGCGVGGPARSIARYSGATVIGLNICDYQMGRARDLTEQQDLQHLVSFVKGDYHQIEYPENTFDGVFAFESTCHAKRPVEVYSSVCRVLKPGARFVDCAWALAEGYDSNNPKHVKIKSDIEYGNGIHQLKTKKVILDDMKKAGMEIVSFEDCRREEDRPWYVFLQGQDMCSLKTFRMSNFGRWTTHTMLRILETFRIVPQGSTEVHRVLRIAADSLIEGAKEDIVTPFFRIVARKPEASVSN